MSVINPNAPCVLGLEWFPTYEFFLAVESTTVDNNTMDWRLISTATETIDRIWVATQTNGSGAAERNALRGGYEIEIYDLADLGETVATDTEYFPTEDVTGHPYIGSLYGFTSPTAGATTNLWQRVDTFTLSGPTTFSSGITAQDSDFLYPIFGESGSYAARVANIGTAHAGQQILALKATALVDQLVALSYANSSTIWPFLVIDDLIYWGSPVTFGNRQPGGLVVEHVWWANPATGIGWDEADLAGFDAAGGTDGFGFYLPGNGNSNNMPVIYGMSLTVRHRPEARVARGGLVNPTPGWNAVTLYEPDGTDNWPKTNATEYLISLRRKTGNGRMLVPDLVGFGLDGIDGVFTEYAPSTREPTGVPESATERDPTQPPGTAAIILQTSGGAISADSVPYTSSGGDFWPSLSLAKDWTRVDNGQTLAQEITPALTDDYGIVKFLACLSDISESDVQDLTVRLRNAGTNAIIDTLTFTYEDLAAPRNQFQVLQAQFPTAPITLTGSTQYLIEFSCPAYPKKGWRVQVLSTLDESLATGDPPTGTEGVTFGGTTDTLRVNGASSAYDHLDACVVLIVSPDPPTGLVAAVVDDGCTTSVDIDWDSWPVDACGALQYYELQRSEDAGVTWYSIARISDDSSPTFTDYEMPRGVEVRYRVRAVRVDGAVSEWSASVTVTTTSTCCGYQFASNAYPALTLWLDDIGPREYEFLENRELVQLQGRDGAIAFVELEDRLDEFRTTLLVAHEGGIGGTAPASPVGRRAFDPLLILAGNKKDPDTGAKASAPYVAVSDSDGNRWFASVAVASGVRAEPGGDYSADVTITELTKIPYPIEVGAVGS